MHGNRRRTSSGRHTPAAHSTITGGEGAPGTAGATSTISETAPRIHSPATIATSTATGERGNAARAVRTGLAASSDAAMVRRSYPAPTRPSSVARRARLPRATEIAGRDPGPADETGRDARPTIPGPPTGTVAVVADTGRDR